MLDIEYKPEYCDLLVNHMSQGYSFDCFGSEVPGASIDVLEAWVADHDEFAIAKVQGEAECLKYWEKIGIAASMGKLPDFDREAYFFNMRNRFQWDKKWTK